MACHDGVDSHGSSFNHNLVPFSLLGKHGQVACSNCHFNARTIPDLKATSQDCYACHQKDDFHAGAYGTNCAGCHTPIGWRPATVDHSKFAFHLDGIHATTACASCHKNSDFKNTPTDCAACHTKDDAHAGALGTLCGACHIPVGWKPATIDHSKFTFHLDGKHATTACVSCHKNSDFKNTPTDCAACHTKDDAHAGSLGTLCGACHTPVGWKPATVDHSKFAFHLDGKHATAACASCHKNSDFKNTPTDCAACHTKDDAHAGSLGTLCGACHTPVGWKPATVDHSKFAFHLDGKHATAACASCHAGGVFKGTPTDCAACHTKDDAHAGTFGLQCGTCHTPADWTSASFDHSKAAFVLTAHKLKSDKTAFVCKDCHVNGYTRPFDQLACANCHLNVNQVFATEHILTFWTNCQACHDGVDSYGASFNHNLVPFNLLGKHAAAKCSECHVNARTIPDLKATSQDCFACHQKDDPHKGSLGTNCAGCHTPVGWKPATIDHSKFAFHLDGKHASAACASCHAGGVFKGTPTDCAACHTKDDAHAGSLGAQCGTCHTPVGWSPATFDHNSVAFVLTAHKTKSGGAPFTCKDCHVNGYSAPFNQTTCLNCHLQINQSFASEHSLTFGTNCQACHDGVDSHGSSFNHNLVPFSLLGKHGQVACSKCHVNARSLPDLKATAQACIACHQKDDHHNGQFGTDCAACHSPEGWGLAKVDHSKFAFHLDGKHAAVACESCHAGGVFKGTPANCAACHSKNDPHTGNLGTQCDTCHTVNGWTPSTFDHSRSIFQLTGKHVSVACQNCHQGGVFKGTPTDCAACHSKNDPHAGKLGAQCDSCHTTNGWVSSTFDHSRASFQLTGQHVTVACAQCHADKIFVGTPSTCAACHSKNDPHGGALGAQCASCHTTVAWKPSTFNHVNSIFKLTGKHLSIACTKCHADLKFKGTPTVCYACHAANDHHGGKYGTNCGACHSTSAWKPATFDHNLSKFPLTGAHVNVACAACHPNGVFVGTPTNCSACHNDPTFHAGAFGLNCVTCHTTSAWRPAKFTLSHPKPSGGDGGSGINHGRTTCRTCHPSTVRQYTCVACHKNGVPGGGGGD
jgi:hypothetical protein